MNIKTYPIILSIAGSDSCGGAGIQADIKTISALGAYAATVITAVTAQNTLGVTDIVSLTPHSIEKQLEAVMTDLKPQTIKIGMLNDCRIIRTIARTLRKYAVKQVVLDPVMVSASGAKLIDDDAMDVLIHELFPLATIVTPNREEAELLTGLNINTVDDMITAADRIRKLTPGNILVKGSSLADGTITDILLETNGSLTRFTKNYIQSKNLHGAGCSLSSAIAVFLDIDYSIKEAVDSATSYIHDAIDSGKDISIGQGVGPICHSYNPLSMKIKP